MGLNKNNLLNVKKLQLNCPSSKVSKSIIFRNQTCLPFPDCIIVSETWSSRKVIFLLLSMKRSEGRIEREIVVRGSASGKCPLRAQISLGSRLLYLQTQHESDLTLKHLMHLKGSQSFIKLNVLVYTQRRPHWWLVSDWNKTFSMVNQLWFSFVDPKAHSSISVRMFMSNLPQEHQFVSVLKCQTLFTQTGAWSLWTSAMTAEEWLLVWPQQVSHRFPLDLSFILSFYIPSKLFILPRRGFCKDPASQHFSFPFSYSCAGFTSCVLGLHFRSLPFPW